MFWHLKAIVSSYYLVCWTLKRLSFITSGVLMKNVWSHLPVCETTCTVWVCGTESLDSKLGAWNSDQCTDALTLCHFSSYLLEIAEQCYWQNAPAWSVHSTCISKILVDSLSHSVTHSSILRADPSDSHSTSLSLCCPFRQTWRHYHYDNSCLLSGLSSEQPQTQMHCNPLYT